MMWENRSELAVLWIWGGRFWTEENVPLHVAHAMKHLTVADLLSIKLISLSKCGNSKSNLVFYRDASTSSNLDYWKGNLTLLDFQGGRTFFIQSVTVWTSLLGLDARQEGTVKPGILTGRFPFLVILETEGLRTKDLYPSSLSCSKQMPGSKTRWSGWTAPLTHSLLY